MPDGNSYTVRSGDTLSKIAARCGSTLADLMRDNGIRDANRISVGQVLKISSGAPAPSPSTGTGANPSPSATDLDWADLIEQNGDDEAKADFAGGKRVVIALRRPTNTKSNQGRGVYDDQMVVVQKANGGLKVAKFPCNTEPSRQYGFQGAKIDTGPDLNRDGRVDQGRLIAGTYHYEPKPGGFLGGDAFRVRSNQTAERDINQDGDFNELDGPGRIDPNSAGRTMYIHRGGDDNTWSAGCQTVQKSRYNAFLAALGGQTSFSYILIDQKS